MNIDQYCYLNDKNWGISGFLPQNTQNLALYFLKVFSNLVSVTTHFPESWGGFGVIPKSMSNLDELKPFKCDPYEF